MIGKLITAYAGRSLARSVGGTVAGPVGAVIGAAAPAIVKQLSRRVGPVGILAAAAGGVMFTRFLGRRVEQREEAKRHLKDGGRPVTLDTTGKPATPDVPLPNLPV